MLLPGEWPVALAFSLGPTEIGLIVLIVVLLFGATQLPKLARSLGRARGEFEHGKREAEALLRGAGATRPDDEDEEDRRRREAAEAARKRQA